MLYTLLYLALTAILYLIPLIIWLPFKVNNLHKTLLFLVTCICLCPMAFGLINNIGVIILLAALSAYLSFIDRHCLLNICILVLSYLFNVVVDNLCGTSIWWLFHIDNTTLQETPAYFIPFNIVCIFTVYLLSKLLLYIFKKFYNHLELKYLPARTAFFICVQLFLTLVLFVVNIVEGQHVGYSPGVVSFNTSVFFAYFIISVGVILYAIQTYKKMADFQMKQESFQALQQYTAQVEALYNSIRSFKHDYVNILMTMYVHIDNKDMDGLSAYFSEKILPLTKQLEPQNYNIARLANLRLVELKSIVTAKIIYAQEMNIDVAIEADTPVESVNTDVINLVRMLGIFLDNAIEAALETPKPSLDFIVISDDSETIFMINNSFINHGLQLSELHHTDVSTKGKTRGMGLYNVSQILQQHDNLFLDTHAEKNIFSQVLHIYS